MTPVLLRFRAELRTRWPAWVAVALLAGIGGAVVLTLLASARRTDAAYPEFAVAHRASDVLLAGKSDFGLIGAVDLDEVARLPEVTETARATASLLFTGRTGDGRRVAVTVPVALLFGNAIAAIPAWVAGRTRAAAVLRSQ